MYIHTEELCSEFPSSMSVHIYDLRKCEFLRTTNTGSPLKTQQGSFCENGTCSAVPRRYNCTLI